MEAKLKKLTVIFWFVTFITGILWLTLMILGFYSEVNHNYFWFVGFAMAGNFYQVYSNKKRKQLKNAIAEGF